jgi:hypothetical protein
MTFTQITPRARSTPATRSSTSSASSSSSASPAVAAQHGAFDAQTAERAELLRELNALEDLMLAQLKNEDEIMKKWIAMI